MTPCSAKPSANNHMKTKLIILAFIAAISMPLAVPLALAQTEPPAIDISDPKFRLVVCDGPAGANINNDPNFVPCDFYGLMKQVKYLINVMIVLGVIAAMIGFAYTGYLYITGTPGNRSKAHTIFPKIFWGFVIMLVAWFAVYQILEWLTGNADGYLLLKK